MVRKAEAEPTELRHKVIAAGIATADEYKNIFVTDSVDTRIGPSFGLDERKTRDEIGKLLASIEKDSFDRALGIISEHCEIFAILPTAFWLRIFRITLL